MKIFTKGTCTFDSKEYNIFAISNSSSQIEIFLTDLYAHIESSYKFDGKDEYSFNNNQSKEVWKFIKNGISKCTTKNVSLVPIKGIGTVKRYSVTKGKSDWSIDKYDGQFCGVEASGVTNEGKQITVYLEKCDSFDVQEIPYIKLTNLLDTTIKNSLQTEFEGIDSFEETIPVRSLAEIGLEKDITWLNNKKYYIVNDEVQAEFIFNYLENYNGIISYDTETTGLCMNMFGEVGSERKKFIDAENERLRLEGKPVYKVDKLVGIIFCVERDVSYYFPCGNRKFKNIYSDFNNETTKRVSENILARYTVGDLRESKTSMANYIRNTPMNEWSSDVILMERVRNILEKKWIGAHHGSFEYKVGMMYSIDTNLKDDSMLLHQLLFKFRSTTSNRGEPSNLKYLTKVEFGIDQLDLKDFFVTYAEDSSGLARQDGKKKKKSSNIDFSYMDYDGAKAYAPADGDFTLGLIIKYKKELNTPELKSQEYLYSVEVLVSCAIGYMEYYGHRLDENKIEATKINTYSDMLLIEKKIRDFINANTVEELAGFDKIKGLQEELSIIEKDMTSTSLTEDEKILTQEKYEKVLKELDEKNMEVRNMIDTSENLLNLGSPQQVCELFYEKLGIPAADKDKPSVAKRAIKPLSQAKDENNKLKYPVVKLYMDWKNCNTLLTKFFDNLPAYSYPGGFIFSSYGQISTATGRMSCIAEGTKISMPGELRNIEDVKIGDYVYCYDELGNLQLSRVMDVLDNGIQDCVKVNWKSSGRHDEGSVICTPDHKFRLVNGEWVEAHELIIGDKITHLRISNEDRPRLYGSGSFVQREQDFLKLNYFKCEDSTNYVIHHKDEKPSNNKLSNLKCMKKIEHSRYHANKLLSEGKINISGLSKPHRILSGKEHPNYINVTINDLKGLIYKANGVISKIDMDFNTFKKKCFELNFDYEKEAALYRTYYKNVDDKIFLQIYNECRGIPYAIHKKLGIGRTKVENTIKRLGLEKPLDYNKDEFIKTFFECEGKSFRISKKLGLGRDRVKTIINELDLCYNHKIISVELESKHHVYDLVVEGYHNFIANELVVHNCSKPNAQQYPHSVTKMVIPRHGCVFADADYSQIEYRTLTAMAKEPALMDKFKDPDMDYHTTMASLMYDVPYANVTGSMRSEAKTFNFGIPYGMGLKKLAFQLKGSESPEAIADAQIKYDLYFKEQPNVKKFFDDVKEGARIYGYTKTKWGRRRYFSFTDESGKLDTRKMGAALRQAGNAVIQGCLSPDTRIQTKDNGIVPIEKVVGQHLLVWSGDKWTNGDITYSGKKQKCIVKFSTGQEFVCSPIHKFLVKSHRGNERFVECKDLRGSINSTNPHRVVINRKYEPSDYKYSSEIARELYKGKTSNSNNVYLDDIGDSFKIGVVLGRLASDGNITNSQGNSIRQFIAEHELNIAPKLMSYMENLNYIYKEKSLRENRNEIVNHLNVYSKSLVSEITDLDIKHQVHDNIFMDTELLRGFLRGFFDGDGGITGHNIVLVFGKQYNFEPMCKDIQKALLFFGIRSYYKEYEDRYIIRIKTKDNQKFLDLIGFINEEKQKAGRELKPCVKDEHIFGSVLVVESVEITDEYIDMYDVCNTDDGYYVADGIITHNTAADIFKIGVARNFLFIRDNNLFGKYFITNMVHDEQLVEISCELNVKTILANLIKAMELHIDGFPPLFVGAGIGESWDEAKGKMAEIHPILGKTFVKEVEDSNDGLYATDHMTPEEVYIYFNKRNYEFREQKILDYVLDESNYGQALHPVIGSLLGLQFDYGVSKELKERFPKDGEGISYTKEEKEKAELQSPMERLKRFIEAHNLDIDVNNFVSTSVTNIDEEILDEYVDEMDEDLDDLDIDMTDDGETGISAAFKLIDESTEYFGCSLKDLIKTMGIVVSHKQHIVGINWNGLTFASQQRLSKYLSNHLCNQSDSGAYRVLLLNNVGQLMPKPDQQQMFINNISENYLSDNVEIS